MKRNILLILLAIIPFFAFGYRDPETGTFITRDPAGMADGPNLYTYVHQNPWTHFDPEGLFPDAQTTFATLNEKQTIGVSKDVAIGTIAATPFAFVGVSGIPLEGAAAIGWGGRMAYMGLQMGGAGVIGRSISDSMYGTSSTTQELSGTGAFSAIAGVTLDGVGRAISPAIKLAQDINAANVAKRAMTPGSRTAEANFILNAPKEGSLDNIQTRDWYNGTKTERNDIIQQMRDSGASDEEIAKAAWQLRNDARTKARALMSDRTAAAKLDKENPNMTWDQTMDKYKGDYKTITEKSLESNKEVNKKIEDQRAAQSQQTGGNSGGTTAQ